MGLADLTESRRRRFLSFGVVFFLCFLGVATAVAGNVFSQADYTSMVSLQALITRSADVPFSLLTLLGSSELTALILGSIIVWNKWRARPIPWSLFCIITVFIVEIVGKSLITHPRPPQEMNRYTLEFSFPSSGFAPANYSFPSGHMARSSYVAVLLFFLIARSHYRHVWKILLALSVAIYILIVFVSRIYLGAHWVSDVMGGIFLGLSVSLFTLAYWPRQITKN